LNSRADNPTFFAIAEVFIFSNSIPRQPEPTNKKNMNSNPEKTGVCKCNSPKRLVLCFDGTDDKFSADESDTNIVKIYELLDRQSPDQYDYYQR
jgi:uncharacterized protein (DUF2235 family)